MVCWLPIVLSLVLFADADLSRVSGFREWTSPPAEFPTGVDISILPAILPALDGQKEQNDAGGVQPDSRLAIIRFVSGEFVRVVRPLPGGKQGFLLKVGEPLNQKQLERSVATHGAAVHPGDAAQITHVEFRGHQIIVDVNGGGRQKRSWREHLQIGMNGGGVPVQTSTSGGQQDEGPPGIRPGAGSTLYLEFGKRLPDLSPDELKKLLSPLLDFSKQRSAAVQWVDTLPPEFQKAIKERRAAVGMDREMVLAAVGPPDSKVRERDADGYDTEDWIYGVPPSQTVFVRFQGERVASIKRFP